MYIALTRSVPPSIVRCELTHVERVPVDVATAVAQHNRYEEALRELGCRIERLPDEPSLPDSVFVEDTAIVLDEIAMIMRPGAESRRAETRTVESALAEYRLLHRIEPPGTMDGGDVLCVGRRVFVGLSTRTNEAAVSQLAAVLAPHGYSIHPVLVRGCLHLKSAVTALDDDLVLLNPECVEPSALEGTRSLEVDPTERRAANIVALDGHVVCQDTAPRTARRLESAGFTVHPVDASELGKAEGGLTCCSLIFRSSR